MKQLLLLSILLMTTASFAASTNDIKTLGNAWKSKPTFQLQPNKEIVIVYGGEDIFSRQTIEQVTTVS